jgi:hypothetical protein
MMPFPFLYAQTDTIPADYKSGGGKIRSGNILHKLLGCNIRLMNQGYKAVYNLTQVVRWDIGSHAYGNAGRPVDQKAGRFGWQYGRFLKRSIVVFDEVDCILVDIGQVFLGQFGHTNFGITHGRGRIAVDGSKVTLAVHQEIPHGKILGHTHHGVIYGLVSMGMVFTYNVTNHAGGFFIGFVVVIAQVPHGEQNPPVNGLQSVTNVGKGSSDDHTHGVIKIRPFDFFFDTD